MVDGKSSEQAQPGYARKLANLLRDVGSGINMTTDTYNSIIGTATTIMRMTNLLQFVGLFVWLAGWYILYQITRLRFIVLIMSGVLLLMLSQVVGFESIRSIRHPRLCFQCVVILRGFSAVVGTVLHTTGACLGLRYLQKKWTQIEASQPAAPR
jgi:hypothetical protein